MLALTQREKNRQARQDQILAAALRVFSEAGYSGASMDVIAAQAGLNKPTLYHHFASKEHLFQAMMAAQRDVILLAFDAGARRGLVDHLVDFAWSYADTVMRPEFLALARLIIGEAHRFPDVGRDYQQSGPDKVLAGLMAFFVDQRDLGRLAFADAELAAEDFWGLILSAPRNRALHEPDADIGRATVARYIHNNIHTFLRAYSTDLAADLARLEQALADAARSSASATGAGGSGNAPPGANAGSGGD